MGKNIESLKVRETSFIICSAEVRNRWWQQGTLLLPVDDGRTWHGETQEVIRFRVLMPVNMHNSYRKNDAVKAAANFLSRARNRSKQKLGQDILTVKPLGAQEKFDVAVIPLGAFGNFSAFLPEEWAELLAWNALPDPEVAARQIVAIINEGTYDETKAITLLNQSIQKVDAYDELHERLTHFRRYQPGFNSKNYSTKKPYKSKPTDEDYREPDDPWDDDK